MIQGGVNVDATTGKAIADIKIVDPKTGRVVDHIVVAGDPGLRDGEIGNIGDIGPFLHQLGKGTGSRVCMPKSKPKPKPKPGPPPPPPSNTNTLDYSGTLDGSAPDEFTGTTVTGTATVHLAWSEHATSPSSDPSTVTWKLTSLTGTVKRQSSDPAANCSATFSIKPGADSFFSPGINHPSTSATYTVQANSPANVLAGSSSPAAFQIQSSDTTSDLCGDPVQSLREVENPVYATTSSGTALDAALNPMATVPRGHSDTPFNFSFSQSGATLRITSTVSFLGS